MDNEYFGSNFDGLKISCFVLNCMVYVNFLRLLYSFGEGRVFLNMIEIEVIVSKDLELDYI